MIQKTPHRWGKRSVDIMPNGTAKVWQWVQSCSRCNTLKIVVQCDGSQEIEYMTPNDDIVGAEPPCVRKP